MSRIIRIMPDLLPDPLNPRFQVAETQPLINPDMVGTMSPAQRDLIGLTQAVAPQALRAEQMMELEQSVAAVNAYIRSTQDTYSIQFELHQRSGLTYALIRNMDTGQVLKQIPSDTLLNIAARVRAASGIFVDMAT
jgi:uncharacterized FlaG/YvyC family protein